MTAMLPRDHVGVFSFHAPPPSSSSSSSHHRHRQTSSICSLPSSPLDPSNERAVLGHKHGAGRHRHKAEKRRVSADPATLFLLHRAMKGDCFSLYTVSASSPPTVRCTPVFVFYDAHNGRLGSLYWSSQRKVRAVRKAYEADEGDSPSTQPDTYERVQSPSQCLPLHTITFVQHGRTEALSASLVTSLPSSCFLALHSGSGAPPLLLSHPQLPR